MVDNELYLAFVLATIVLIVLPGPNVTLIVANSLAAGARAGLLTVAGTSAATALLLAVAALGMSSLISLLAEGFAWLRWAGVAYLLYLGLQQWRRPPDPAAPPPGRQRIFWQGFVVSATNPKTLLFYVAFLPQFIDPGLAPGSQLMVLSVTFLVIATLIDGAYGLLAGRFSGALADARKARLRRRLSGTFLIAAALGLALARKTP
ncbi:MAG TPA: LysE family translocator [Alphaproteobacteria bacterium]|nr:LysE family translocator [Alphaproteobacteria bacterium]MDP6268935.1 LysE family translocator [Alphaproteobacteria bacterium]HJM49696.1 LysE family translocator [Alphaproteobacteria bacterium]